MHNVIKTFERQHAMAFNAKGRFYFAGKCIDKSVRGDIIDDVLKKMAVIVRRGIFLDVGLRLPPSTEFMGRL